MTTYHDMTRHETTHHHTTATSIEQQQWLNHHHHHHHLHHHHHHPNHQQQGEAATAANFMREIAREIEQKRAAIRSALDESRVNELLIELSQNVLNTFLQRTTTTQIPTSSIPTLLKRSLLITYAYLIEHQNEHDDINNNNLNNTPSSSSSSSSTNSFCHLVKNLSKYEQNIATQLNRIYSSVVNLLGDTSVSSSSSSSLSSTSSSTSSISYNNTSYSTAFNQTSSLNDLKMLHFLLILFNSFMNHFEDDEVDENELVNGNLMEDVNVGFIDIDGENLNLDQKYDIINETNNESVVNGGDDEFSFVNLQDMNVGVAMTPPKSSTLFNCVAKAKQTIKNFALEAFECQKYIIKLIDRLLINHGGNVPFSANTTNSSRNSCSKIIKTKILLSIADLDI